MRSPIPRLVGILATAVAASACSVIVDVGDLARDDGGREDTDALLDADVDVEPDADADGGEDLAADADADADTDGDAAADGDADAGADADADADSDAEGEADGGDGSSTCAGGWFDPSSGLCWEEPPAGPVGSWDGATAYCDGLSLGGFGPGSWRLPNISMLRSLIRGCASTVTGGPCGVTNACLDSGCRDASCDGCASLGGPGAGGAYWPPGFGGSVAWPSSWSSSIYAGNPSYVWHVDFSDGSMYYGPKVAALFVYCVRSGP